MNHCVCCNLISKTNIALYCGSCVLWVERFPSIYPILSNRLQGIMLLVRLGCSVSWSICAPGKLSSPFNKC